MKLYPTISPTFYDKKVRNNNKKSKQTVKQMVRTNLDLL